MLLQSNIACGPGQTKGADERSSRRRPGWKQPGRLLLGRTARSVRYVRSSMESVMASQSSPDIPTDVPIDPSVPTPTDPIPPTPSDPISLEERW